LRLGSFRFEVEDPVGEAQEGCTCASILLTLHDSSVEIWHLSVGDHF